MHQSNVGLARYYLICSSTSGNAVSITQRFSWELLLKRDPTEHKANFWRYEEIEKTETPSTEIVAFQRASNVSYLSLFSCIAETNERSSCFSALPELAIAHTLRTRACSPCVLKERLLHFVISGDPQGENASKLWQRKVKLCEWNQLRIKKRKSLWPYEIWHRLATGGFWDFHAIYAPIYNNKAYIKNSRSAQSMKWAQKTGLCSVTGSRVHQIKCWLRTCFRKV